MEWNALLRAVAAGEACTAGGPGTELTGDQVKALLAAARSDTDSRKILTNVSFAGVTFVGPVRFGGVRFAGDVSFAGATFTGDAEFVQVQAERCSFNKATFGSTVYVDGWRAEAIQFESAIFESLARFYDLETRRDLSFSGSTFKGPTAFSDLKIDAFLNFVRCTFSERIHDFVAGCRSLHLQNSKLERGGVFYLHGGEVEVANAEMGASTMIAGTRKSGSNQNGNQSLVVDGGDWRPRLTTLEGSDVDKLVLQDVDLTPCRFQGSFNLERLRLEGLCRFDEPPKGLHAGIDPPFLWRWTPRRCLLEERIWRYHSRKGQGWRVAPARREPGEPLIVDTRGDPFAGAAPAHAERQAQAEQLAKTYRALRKGREEAKNEPGAGDFYYGEMEMRRAGTAHLGERVILGLYWLLSGYGLRPLRTSVALLVLMALSTLLLMQYGLACPDTYPRAFLASLAASVDLEYLPPEAFTLAGHWTRIALKILGPTLYGVLLLAVWGRVKR